MSAFQLIENPDTTLTLQQEGQEDIQDVRLRRSFPWSKADLFISIRDEKGKEQALIENLDQLAPDQKTIVQKWLAANSFVPVIKRVNSVNMDFGYQQWDVESDRGGHHFRVQEREDIRFLPDGRFSVKDVDGNIYALPSLDKLDPASRTAVEALL